MTWQILDSNYEQAKITVIGVGGGGGNSVHHMIKSEIKGVEFIYPGTSRLVFGEDGRILKHRDYFDFVGPTFTPVPIIGPFVQWIYKRFIS